MRASIVRELDKVIEVARMAIKEGAMSAVGVRELKNPLAQLTAQGVFAAPQRRPLKRVRRVKVCGPPLSTIISEDRR